MSQLWDSMMFFNEFDCLKIRCEELKPLNPVHVIIESMVTFSGKPKPSHFKDRKSEFSKYQIITATFPNIPGDDPWKRENDQRDWVSSHLYKGMWNDDDTWILSDCDEIPRASAVANWKGQCARLDMRGYRYYLNRQPHSGWWHMPRIVSGKYLRTHSPTQIRNTGCDEFISDAGWHFSWLGGWANMKYKLESFAHTEMNIPEYNNPERWLEEIEAKPYHPIDSTYPKYLVEHQDEFAHLIHPVSPGPIVEHRDIGPEDALGLT